MGDDTPYKRVLLKLSGEVLGGRDGVGIQTDVINNIALSLKPILAKKIQIAIVIGAGNIFRGGKQESPVSIDRVVGDKMGMTATLINALAIQNIFEKNSIPAVVQSAIEVPRIAELFSQKKAIQYLDSDYVVIFGGGTGNPFFTTDSAAALRAAEIQADVILKATKVDGVYDKDPVAFPDAKFYEKISFTDVLQQNLKVMDSAAISVCKDNKIPIIVFNFYETTALNDILLNGKSKGTYIGGNE